VFDSFKGSSVTAKLVTIFVVGILLGLGLCGVGASLSNKFSNVANGFFVLGASSFWLSSLGLVMSLVVLFIFGLGNRDR
jgi:hypothetical protein